MITFHCPSNPSFRLHKIGAPIRFENGFYTTSDPDEIRRLRACKAVNEVDEHYPVPAPVETDLLPDELGGS